MCVCVSVCVHVQTSKRSDAVSPDRQRLEASLQALEQEMLERASAMLITPPSRDPQPKPPTQVGTFRLDSDHSVSDHQLI